MYLTHLFNKKTQNNHRASRNDKTPKLITFNNHRVCTLILCAGLIVNMQTGIADDVPVGFKKQSNGEIVVADPIKAFAPSDYKISKNGVLKKINTSAATKDDSRSSTSALLADLSNEDNKLVVASTEITEVPPGFHRMPNGDVMANNPTTAKVPPGYELTEGGILKMIERDKPAQMDEVPPGFHRMPNGDIMANNPSTAKAPSGYYIGANGVLFEGARQSTGMRFGGGGMWMFEYMYMYMKMEDLLDTTNTVSPDQLFDPTGPYCRNSGGCMMVPTEMVMNMHMFMGMYHTRDYMLMAMVHYLRNDMRMLSNDGVTSTMDTKGFGDTVLTAQFRGPMNVFFDFGLSIPTGSITERGPMTHNGTLGTEQNVPYPYGMQLGSGTYDYMQGLTYMDSSDDDKRHWGASYLYTGRIRDNDSGYKLGDVLKIKSWFEQKHTSELKSRLKAELKSWGQIEGEDKNIANHQVFGTGPAGGLLNMSPTMDADNYGGVRLDLAYRLKWENNQMTSFSAEFVLPVYQDLYGPQMETSWIVSLTAGYMF